MPWLSGALTVAAPTATSESEAPAEKYAQTFDFMV